MLNVYKLLFLLLANVAVGQSPAWQRAEQMQRGVNLSYLESYWAGDPAQHYADYLARQMNQLPAKVQGMGQMASLGLRTVRIPVTFDKWVSKDAPYRVLRPEYWAVLDTLVRSAMDAGLMAIIDYHHGDIDGNLVNGRVPPATVARNVFIWQQVARRYARTDPNRVLFEVYNEPHNLAAPQWQPVLDELVRTVRAEAPQHTIIVSGIDWGGISGLQKLQPLADENLIYSFHLYDPMLFTHQGAEWVDGGKPVSTKGMPFPASGATLPPLAAAARGTWGENAYNSYGKDATATALNATLQVAKTWSTTFGKPVFCGEFGAYNLAADADSRCRYMGTMISALGRMNIPFAYWEWDGGFSIGSAGAPAALPVCMKMALDSYVANNILGLPIEQVTVLMPNPATGFVNVVLDDSVRQIDIEDTQGRLIRSIMGRWGASTIQIDIRGLSPTMHFVRLWYNDGRQPGIRRFVKQ